MKKLAIKALKIFAFAVIVLASLMMLAGAIISYSSRKDWAREKAGLLAKGEKLSFAELVPEAHMDDRNFFFDPMWLEVIETKPKMSDSIFDAAEPKVPEGERQLDQMNGKIPPELKEKLSLQLSDVRGYSEPSTVRDLGSVAHQELLFMDQDKRKKVSLLVLEAVRGSAPLRARIEELLARPEAVIPYDPAWGLGNPRYASEYVYRLGEIYSLIALAHYGAGDYRACAREIRHLLLLADVFRSDPFFYAVNARTHFFLRARILIDDGIRSHVWTENELAGFQTMFGGVDIPADTARSFRAERGGFNQFIEAAVNDRRGRDEWRTGKGLRDLSQLEEVIAKWTFPFCIATDQARLNRLQQLIIEGCEKPEGPMSENMRKLESVSFPWRGFHALSISQESLWPTHLDYMLLQQDEFARMEISCALERYRMATGDYPGNLDKLVSEYLPEIPRCVIPQRSFSWSREAGKYHLKLTGTDDVIFPNAPL